MIIELTEKDATTGDTERKILRFDENEFIIWHDRIEKVKFLRTEHILFKTLDFLDMLTLSIWENLGDLTWHKKQ